MIGENFQVGDTVRILTLEEMKDTLQCTKRELQEKYDVVERMFPHGNERHIVKIVEKSPSNFYLKKNDPDGYVYRFDDCPYTWYSWALTRVEDADLAEDVDLSDWSSLFDVGETE